MHSARGAALRQLGRDDEAASAYDAALELDPRRFNALRGRGRTAMERGESGAYEYYRLALEQKPGDLNPRPRSRSLAGCSVVAGLIYGLVNVRTDGQKILAATEAGNTVGAQTGLAVSCVSTGASLCVRALFTLRLISSQPAKTTCP